MKLRPSEVRKYTRFPKSGSVLGGFDIKEATLDIDNGTWFVMFDGKVSRRQARQAMSHFVNRVTNVPTNTRSFSSPRVVPITMKCDEVTTVLSNPSGRVTIAKGHLSFDGVLKNPTSASKFKQEMNDMVTHSPHKVFREFDYKKLNDAAFLDQLWSFVSYSGESYGWVTNKGKVFHRRASLIMPKIKINKRPDNEVAFYHTHPSKDEPSLTSADDIQFYADLAFAPGVKHNYTVMRDRIDYFQFDVKKSKVDEYLKIDEDHFVKDVDAMIEDGEAAYKDDKSLDPVEFCRLVTQHMVDSFNTKYKGLMKITYKHFVNPNYEGDEGPLANPLPNPLPNPTRPTIPSKLQHHSLNDLQGVDYDFVHYGGDEFAHTLYTYYWMWHHFGANSEGKSRLYKLENVGFDSDLRKKTRAYLSQRITANWTFLDLLYAVGLYHDIGKVREKETGDHHSIAGKYMWDEFIADALDVPHTFEDIVSTMLESDIGRRNISDDFFQTQVGEYYGVALIMQMADIATHHPHMFTPYAATARKAGLFKGDVHDYKMWAIGEKVKKLEKFLEKPLKNPRPAATQITWRGDYGIDSVNFELALEVLNDYRKSGRDSVFHEKQGGSTFYMGFTSENIPRLKGVIPEGEEVSVNFWPNSTKIAIFFTQVHQQKDFGAKAAQIIYEEVGEILQGVEPSVKIDKVENAILVNPRKAKRTKVILVSGPPGTGKSTFIRFLKNKFPGVGEPLTVTTRARRPKEKDGVDRIFVSETEFEQMIEQDQFIEWAKQKNGHYYGRRWVDFKFPVNVVDLNLKGIRAYKEAFPHAYTVFLAPDIPPKSMVKRIMRRGGVTLDEAKRRAAIGPTMVAGAKRMQWDQFVKVKSGSYDKVFEGMVKNMGDVLTNPRVHESQVMITIGPQIPRQQTFDGQVLPFNERDRRYMRERERSIDFNRTAVGEDYTPFTIPAYFTDEQLPTGTIRSPVNRQNVLVPSAHAPAFESFLTRGELPISNAPIFEPDSWQGQALDKQPETGKAVGPFGHKFKGTTSRGKGKPREILVASISPEFMERYRPFEADLRAGIPYHEALKKHINMTVYPWQYGDISTPPQWVDKFVTIDEMFKTGGVCRHLAILSGMFLERALETGVPNESLRRIDKVFYAKGIGHGWLFVRHKAGEIYLIDPAQSRWEPLSWRRPTDWWNYPDGQNPDNTQFYVHPEHGRQYYNDQLQDLEDQFPVAMNNPKDLFDWFEEWVHLINMKNKELKAFLDSPLGKKAGLSKKEADEQGIKSGRVSGRRILKMRAKLGLTGPKDYIKIGPRIIEDYYEKALNNWTGPSDDPLKGETDWDWCKRQVRFVKRHGAFPYNDNQKGPLVREQKTQNQVSRRLLGLWVWGHDPWRWARKHDVLKMPPCPDVPWIGMTEKRKYGKVEVLMNPADPFVTVNPPKRIKPTELAKKAINSITKKNYIDRGYFGSVFNIPGTKYVFKVERLAAPEYYDALLKWLAGKGKKPSFPMEQRRVWKYGWDFDAQDFSFPLYAIGDGVSQRYHTIMEYLEADKLTTLLDMNRGPGWSPYEKSKTVLAYLERMASMHQSAYDRFVRNFAKAREHGLMDDGNPQNIMIGEKRIHLLDWFWEYGPSEFVTASSFDPYYVEAISGAIEMRNLRRRLMSYVRYRSQRPRNRPKKGVQAEAFRNMTETKYWKATENYTKSYDLLLKVWGKFVRALDKFDVPLDGRTAFAEREIGAGALSWNERVSRVIMPPEEWPILKLWTDKRPTGFRDDELFDWGLQEVAANPPTPHHGDAIITRQEMPWGTVIIAECPLDGNKGGIEAWMENECNHIYPPCGHVLRINPDKPCCCEKSEHPPAHSTHWPNTRSNPRTPGGKKVPTRYLKGLTKIERMIAEDEIDKGYEYDVNDPKAYEFWKSDIKAKARGLKIGSSKHKEEYYRRYRQNIDPDYKPSGKTSKQKFLNRIRKETGIKKSILEKTYDKGLAAWRTGHRPGVQQHQWAAGRVYALAVGADSSTGPGKPDHSLAKEAGVR